MNDFSREELNKILWHLTTKTNTAVGDELVHKVQSMIEGEQIENEIYSCYTGLAVGDDFFCKRQHMTADDLLPAIHQLANQCDGMIKQSGIYALKLRLVKMK